MKTVLNLLILVVCLSSGVVYADGNELMNKCAATERFMDRRDLQGNDLDIGYCLGYLQGVRNVMQVFQRETNICWPKKGIDNGQAVRIIMKYMRDNPSTLHEDQLVIVIRAFRQAYSC